MTIENTRVAGFDPNRSQVSGDALADFILVPICEDITSVPGIGPCAAKKLARELDGEPGVETTYQLIGKFLSLRAFDMSSQEHCDAMWYWLQAKGISSCRAGIVHSLAEKVNIWMPGTTVIGD